MAERIRTVHTIPDGYPGMVASAVTVSTALEREIFTSDGIAYIVPAIKAVVAALRGVNNDVGKEDATSAGILECLIGGLEQQV